MVRLGDLYEAITDEAAYAQLPAAVAKLIGARSGNIQHLSLADGLLDHHYSYFDPSTMDDFAARFSRDLDIWTGAGVGSGIVNRSVSMDELVPEPVFRASAMWNDFFRVHGDDTGHSLGLVHQMDETVMVTSLHRAWSAGSFLPIEAAQLDAISADLHRIYRARRLLHSQAERSSRLTTMLDVHRDLVLLVDGTMRIIEASPATIKILQAGDGIGIKGGRLTIDTATVSTEVHHAISSMLHRRPIVRSTFLVSRPTGKTPWRIMILPTSSVRYCSLLLSDGNLEATSQTQWMRECFGLTNAECEVGLRLLAGDTAEIIATRRATSVATIRTHVRRILEKTEMRRVADVIALFARLP